MADDLDPRDLSGVGAGRDAAVRIVPGEPLLVEDVLLLLFQPDSGTIAGENTLFYVLGGAVLGDLARSQRVEVRIRGLSSKVHAVGAAPMSDPLLAPAWSFVSEKPRDVQTVLAAIGPSLRKPVLDRLVERGDLTSQERRTLGIFPSTKLTLGSERRALLIEQVRAALVDGETPEPRTGMSIALLSASGTLSSFYREIPWSGEVFDRGKEFERGDWGASAASVAVTRTMISMVTNSILAATSGRRA